MIHFRFFGASFQPPPRTLWDMTKSARREAGEEIELEGERQIAALKAAIQQRDSLLRIIREPDDDAEEEETSISDNPSAPVQTRLRNLQKQLRERDDALEKAGGVADELLKNPPVQGARSPDGVTVRRPPASSLAVAASDAASESRLVPQKVSRPSWLARPDPSAGGDRLRARLHETDERFAQLYRQQQRTEEVNKANTVNIVILYIKNTRALTYENFCQEQRATVTAVRSPAFYQQDGQGAHGHFPILGTLTPTSGTNSRASRRRIGSSESGTVTSWSVAVPAVAAQTLSRAGSPPRTLSSDARSADRGVNGLGFVGGGGGAVAHPSLRSPRVATFGQDTSAAGSVGYDASVGERGPTKDGARVSVKAVEKMPPAPRLKNTWHLPSHQQVAPKPWTLRLNPRP